MQISFWLRSRIVEVPVLVQDSVICCGYLSVASVNLVIGAVSRELNTYWNNGKLHSESCAIPHLLGVLSDLSVCTHSDFSRWLRCCCENLALLLELLEAALLRKIQMQHVSTPFGAVERA